MQPNFPIRVFLSVFVVTISVGWSESAVGQDAPQDYQDWPAGVEARRDLSRKRSYDYEFSRISVQTLQTWLGRIGIEIPVDLDGELSGWVWVQRSANGWLDIGNYKLEGEIRSPDLKIDKWLIKEARVRFGYAGGNWYVGKISGEFRSVGGGSSIGIADANAKILTASNSVVEIAAKVDRIDLKALLGSFGLEIDIENSGGSVSLVGAVPIANISDLSKWKASAEVAVDDVVLPWIESRGKAFASLKLDDAKWEVTDSRVKVAGQDVKLAGTGVLNADLPFELSLVSSDIDASQLLRQLKNPDLAKQLDGSIQLTAKVDGTQSRGIAHAVATIESAFLDVRSQPIKNLKVVADYTPARIQLDIATAELAGGTVGGFAAWQNANDVIRGIPSEAALKIKTVELDDLVLVELPIPIGGQASGVLSFGTKKRDGLDDWNSSGQLQVDSFKAAGTGFGDAKLAWTKELNSGELLGNVNLHQGNGSIVSNVSVEFDNQPGSTMRATTLRQYRAEGQLKSYDFVARIGTGPAGVIPMRLLGRFDISGSPAEWLEQGEATLSNSLAKIGDRLLRLELMDVSFNESEYRVERFRLLDPDGRIAGAASLRRDNAGEHLLRLRLIDVPLNTYLERIVPTSLSSFDGVASLDFELRKNAASDDLLCDWTGGMRGNLSSLKYKGNAIGELDFQGDIDDDLVTANVDGQIIGGVAKGTLILPLSVFDKTPASNSVPARTEVKIASVQAQRLAGLLFESPLARKIAGSISVEFSAAASSYSNLEVVGKIQLPLIKYQSNTIARDLTANLRYSGNKLSVARLSGGFAGGRIDAQGYLKLDQEDISTLGGGRINFVAQRLDANRLVSIVDSDYAKHYEGSLDYRGTAVYHRGIQLAGSATARNAKLFGIPIQVARGKLRTEFTKLGGFSRAVSRDLHGSAVGGSFAAALDIRRGTKYTLKTSGNVSRGKLEQLGRAIGFERIVGSGVFNGSFDLSSNQIQSIRALTGGLKIDFENGDVNSIPLLSSIDRFVPLSQFGSTDIENGRLNARVGQGQLRISDLIVNSNAFLLAANGNAALDGSRLDLDLVVQTGGGVQQQLTLNAIDRLLLFSVPQVAAVSELNELIRNRSVFLHVAGSTSRPVIQPKTAQTAAKAFVENLGREILGTSPNVKQ